MDVVLCGAIESTSTHAAELLAQGRKAPFAVWATAQTAGRGRRGHHWESPTGNLYLTVVLPPTAVMDQPTGSGLFGCLPLKVAILIARRIEQRCGLRPTLKWPNDILLGGRKVGGLLVEMSSAGGKTAEIIIGIGINLNIAPALAGSYAATSLAAELGLPQEVSSWATDLVETFASDWGELPLEAVPQAFGIYGIAPGSLWREAASGILYQSRGIATEGTLDLVALANHKPRTLTSVEHGFAWIYLGEQQVPLLVADVGNSRIKLAAYKDLRDANPTLRYDFPADIAAAAMRDSLSEIKQALTRVAGWPLHILSVNPQGAGALAAAWVDMQGPSQTITRRSARRWGTGYDISALGMDRLAAIEGYLARLSRSDRTQGITHAVIVSAGTATTIDVVALSGEHFGGWIIPGLKVALKSLRQATHLLPLLDPESQDLAQLGHKTSEAMEQGVLNMTLGAIERAQAMAAAGSSGYATTVILTGGHGPLLSPHLAARFFPDLVLDGARHLVLGGA